MGLNQKILDLFQDVFRESKSIYNVLTYISQNRETLKIENDIDEKGQNYLHYIINCFNKELAENKRLSSNQYMCLSIFIPLLLFNGVKASHKDNNGITPLHLAVSLGEVGTMSILIRNNPEIDCVDKLGETPLHKAACIGNIDIINMLIKSGAKIDCKDELGETPIFKAVRSNKFECVKQLLAYNNRSLHDINKQGDTLLHVAIRADSVNSNMVEFLIEHKINLDTVNLKCETPIYISVKDKKMEIFKLLKDNGADIYTNSIEGGKLFDALIENQLSEPIMQMITYGDGYYLNRFLDCYYESDTGCELKANLKSIIKNVRNLMEDKMRLLLKNIREFSIDFNTANNVNILENELKEVTPKLSDQQAIICLKEDIKKLTKQFKEAEIYSKIEIEIKNNRDISNLVDRNLSFNRVDSAGDSLLHKAVKYRNLSAVQVLVKNGIDINMTNNTKRTALSLAIIRKDQRIIDFLRGKGALEETRLQDTPNKDKITPEFNNTWQSWCTLL